MSSNKSRVNTTFKTPLLNDCTNHLAFQIKQFSAKNKASQKKIDSSYNLPSTDDVTYEFIRGYN